MAQTRGGNRSRIAAREAKAWSPNSWTDIPLEERLAYLTKHPLDADHSENCAQCQADIDRLIAAEEEAGR